MLVLVAALGALLAAQVRLEESGSDPIPVRSPQDPPGLPPVTSTSPLAESTSDLAVLTETVERPLFSSDRRPIPDAPPAPEPAVAAVPVGQGRPLVLELSAVVILADRRMALFQGASAGGATLRADEGEQVDGWTLSQVRNDGVTLERNGESRELVLRTFKPAQRATPVRESRRAPRRRTVGDGQDQQQQTVQQDAAPVPRPRQSLRSPRRRSTTSQKPG
jgi:hypothetical protein